MKMMRAMQLLREKYPGSHVSLEKRRCVYQFDALDAPVRREYRLYLRQNGVKEALVNSSFDALEEALTAAGVLFAPADVEHARVVAVLPQTASDGIDLDAKDDFGV